MCVKTYYNISIMNEFVYNLLIYKCLTKMMSEYKINIQFLNIVRFILYTNE